MNKLKLVSSFLFKANHLFRSNGFSSMQAVVVES